MLVRRLFDAHNRGGGDALLEIYDDLFDADADWKPLIVGVVGFPERVSYRGRAGMERYYRERAEAFGGGQDYQGKFPGAMKLPGATGASAPKGWVVKNGELVLPMKAGQKLASVEIA